MLAKMGGLEGDGMAWCWVEDVVAEVGVLGGGHGL